MNIFKDRLLMIFSLLPFMTISMLNFSYYSNLAWQAIPGILGYFFLIIRLRDDYIKGQNTMSTARRNFIIGTTLYSISMLFTGLWNDNLTFGIIFTYTFYLGVFFYIDSCMDYFSEFLIAITDIFIFIVIGSYIAAVVSPSTSYFYYEGEKCFIGLLSSKNSLQMVMLPGICFIFFRIYYFNTHKKFFYTIIILAILLMFRSGSGTAAVVSVLLPIYLLLSSKLHLSFKGLSITYLIIYFSVVIFRLQDKLFAHLITDVLQKDLTFTGRTEIWDYILSRMIYSPIIGYGGRNDVIWRQFLKVSEAHNGLLEIFLCGGLVTLCLFGFIIGNAGKKLDQFKDNKFTNLLLFFIFMYFFMGLTESVFAYVKVTFWALIIMSTNIDRIIEQANKRSG